MKDTHQLLGNGMYPAFDNLKIHMSKNLVVFLPNGPTDLPLGGHSHSSYEFIVPVGNISSLYIGKQDLAVEPGFIYAINPDQAHGTTAPVPGVYMAAININQDTVKEMAYLIFERSEIYFDQGRHPFSPRLGSLINVFAEEMLHRQTGYEFIVDDLTTELIVYLFRTIQHNMNEPDLSRPYSYKKNVNRSIDFLMENYQGNYSLADVSNIANLSPYHFIRVFKSCTGKTPYEFLLDIKIDKACQLLCQPDKNITEICYICGFNSPSHFSTVFKRKTGVSPSNYRKENTT